MNAKDQAQRTRLHSFNYHDPVLSQRNIHAISGIDYLKSIQSGRIPQPPIARLVGYRMVSVDQGFAAFELQPAEYHYNPFGTVHGGIASTLLDTTMTAAVMTTLERGESCTTVEINVNFIRPITVQMGVIRSEAELLHRGDRMATASGGIFDAGQQLLAHAATTCMIFKQPK